MTVGSTYTPAKYTGNSSTLDFTYSFPIGVATYLEVYLEVISTGVQTLQTQGSDYTLVFDETGGTVSFASAPTALQYVIISRNVAFEQQVSLTTSKVFDPKVIEGALDKLTEQTQQLKEFDTRVPKLALGSTITDINMPAPVAGKAILWNATADDLINSTDDFNDIVTDATAQAVIATTQAGIATTQAGLAAAARIAAQGAQTNAETARDSILNDAGFIAVAADLTNIDTVATDIVNVNSVATNIANVNAVAADLANIDLVAADLVNVDLVAAITADVTAVAAIDSDVTTVASISSDVTAVAADAVDIGVVATGMADVSTCATNIAAIIAAPQAASDAEDARDLAQGYAAAANVAKIEWQGSWSAGSYDERDAVEHNGSSWIATTTTTEEPSSSATDWDLLALRGTDGTGSGDVSTDATSSVDSEIVLYDSTTGKKIKRCTLSGMAKMTSGVVSAATAGTDYAKPDTKSSWTKQQSGTQYSLSSSSASIATDCDNGNNFSHTMTEDTTLANPTNIVAGTYYYTWTFTQHASSAKTLALGNYFKSADGEAFGGMPTTTSSISTLFAYAETTTTLVYNWVTKGVS